MRALVAFSRPLDQSSRFALELLALEAPEGPKADPHREGPDSKDLAGVETHLLVFVHPPGPGLMQYSDRRECPPDRLDPLAREKARGVVEGAEEEEEEVSLELAPRERLCWSQVVVNHGNHRWAHRSSDSAAAAAGGAAAAAAAAAVAAAASHFAFVATLERVVGSLGPEDDREEEEKAVLSHSARPHHVHHLLLQLLA